MTRASAVDGIRQHGLRPAAALLSAIEGAVPGQANRTEWTKVRQPTGASAWVRWQRLGDTILQRRLPACIEPAQWRGFIDGMVFLFPSRSKAERLRAYPSEAGIDQVILWYETAALIAAGHVLKVCRWNNGFPDRRNPPRIRSYGDYRLASEWTAGGISEVVVPGGIEPTVPFGVVEPG